MSIIGTWINKMIRAILVLSSWISLIVGIIVIMPFVLLMAVIIFWSPFQFIWTFWADGISGGSGLNHANDWWLDPLVRITTGHGLMIFFGVIVCFIVWIALLGYHSWVCEKFGIDSPFGN
jgi:hypothetical protein